MQRRLLCLSLLLLAQVLAASAASAQIFAVHFSEERHLRKYAKNLTEVGGEQVVVGEGYENLNWDPATGGLNWNPNMRVKLFVADPGDPTKVPYRYNRDGEREPRRSNYVVDIDPSHIRNVSILIRDDTLSGLAVEYTYRLDQIEALMDERDDHERRGEQWMLVQQRVVAQMERLHSWLANTAFPEAAEDMERDLSKERRELQRAGIDARSQAAFDSIGPVEIPASLAAATEDITRGRIQFKVQESQHLRIVHVDTISDALVSELLLLGEKAIEFYRNEFVDPYVDSDYGDTIPDNIFHEFWLGPDDLSQHEDFLVQYYGLRWNEDRKDEQLATAGARFHGVRGLTTLDYWKYSGGRDLEAIVCHGLGHSLADLHYAGGRPAPAWLEEGSAYYCSLEFLGRNTVTCLEFRESRYAGPDEGEEGDKEVVQGFRDWLNEMALERGPRIDRLALKTLFEMEDPDLAKSWSFFDFIAREEGREGQEWLRAHCQATREEAMINRWRELSEGIWELEPGVDVFRAVDDRWRIYAGGGQDTSDRRR